MDAAAKRREARRRRLLQDPEERLQKIRNLKESSEKICEGSGNDLNTDKRPSSSSSQNQSILQGNDSLPLESPEIEKQTTSTSTEHSCIRFPGSVTPADNKTLDSLQKTVQEDRNESKSSSDSTPASDFSSYLPGLLTIQKFLAEFQSVNSSSSTKTSVAFAIAIVFRLSLELELLKFLTGESMVMIFLVFYLPWLYFFGPNKVKIESIPGALFFSFRIIQDFSCYLFAFIATHGLVTVFTGTSIVDDDQINESKLT